MLFFPFNDLITDCTWIERRNGRPFLKQFRVVGQICREGMDESGILPKARYAMTVFHCLGGGWGAISPPVGPGQIPGGGPGGEAPAILQYTVPKKMPPKNHFLGTFLSVCCIQIERKNSFKLKKFMCKANNSTSCSVNIYIYICCNTCRLYVI